jgi:hypothetical protein
MAPKRDYDDYTRFINDVYVDQKKDILNNTMCEISKPSVFDRNNLTRTNNSSTKNLQNLSFVKLEPLSATPLKCRNNTQNNTLKQRSQSNAKTTGRHVMGINDLDFKPRVLESKAQENLSFMNMSPSFKQVILSADRRDHKMVIPVAGYGGHRRGEKS